MVFMFENKRTEWGDVYYSRLIASWRNAGGYIYGSRKADALFLKWLEEECHCTPDEVKEIWFFATNGKLEYEDSAKRFIREGINRCEVTIK